MKSEDVIINNIIFKPSTEVAPPAQTKNFIRGSCIEVLDVEFKNGKREFIQTMRCLIHVHCDCGLNLIMKLHKNMSNEHSKSLMSNGKVTSYRRLITRSSTKSKSGETITEIICYGEVNTESERKYHHELKKSNNNPVVRKQLLDKYGHEINYCPQVSVYSWEEECEDYHANSKKHTNPNRCFL